MTGAQTDDAALVARLRDGDPSAARELYQRHGRALLRFAVAMADCVASAEDVVHDTFVELLRYAQRYDAERGSLRAYLYGIARHQLAKSRRVTGRFVNEEPGCTELETDAVQPARAVLDQADSTLEEQIDRAQSPVREQAPERLRPPCGAEGLPDGRSDGRPRPRPGRRIRHWRDGR
jgi:RNA polymerase sigma-70 factor, ECF subfamily